MTVTFENGTLKVLLSKTETTSYQIDRLFQNKDKNSAETTLALLYKEALQKISSSLFFDRLIIEVFPISSGGCEITFTPDKTRVPVAIKEKRILAFMVDFCNSENMIETVIALYRSKFRDTTASLYKNNGMYRLLLCPKLEAKQLHNFLILKKCKVLTSPICYAKTCEYWQVLCQKTAIKTLGSAFFKGL